MTLHDRLIALHERMYTAEMPDMLLDAYHMEMELRNFTIPEDDYKKGKAVLEHSLTDEQKDTLHDIEVSWENNMKRAVGIVFLRGLYAGFQKAFVPDTPEDPFQALVVDELLTMSNMRHYTDYYIEREKALMRYNHLYDQVGEITQDHLTSVESAWDERLYGALRYAFNTGFKHALSLVDEIEYKKTGEVIRIEVQRHILYVIYSPEPVFIEQLIDCCEVSRNTIFNDLKDVTDRLKQYDLKLNYNNKRGYEVSGNPIRARAIFILYFREMPLLYRDGILPFFDRGEIEGHLAQLRQIEQKLGLEYVDGALQAIAALLPVMLRNMTTFDFPGLKRAEWTSTNSQDRK